MASTTNPKPRVLIVGAGLGGLALAQALRKQGISFEVFERSAHEERFQGWCLGLHSMLDELVAAMPNDMPSFGEAVDHLRPLMLPAQIAFYLTNNPKHRIGVQDPGDLSIIRANRQRLRAWLATGIDIQFSKVATLVEETEDGATVHFRDGTTARGDIVVGADGVHSPIRKSMLAKAGMTDPTKALPIGVVIAETRLHGRDFAQQLELGHSAYVVPAPGNNGPPLGTMFVGLNSVQPDGQSGDFYWFLAWGDDKAAELPYWTSSAGSAEQLQYVRNAIRNVAPELRAIVDKTSPEGIVHPPLVFRECDLRSLPAGRVTLLGDAAHSMVPCKCLPAAMQGRTDADLEVVRGEGGVHALRDALKLSRAIAKIASREATHEHIVQEFDEYQKEMLERGSTAVRLSRQAGSPGTAAGPIVTWGQESRELPQEHVVLEEVPRIISTVARAGGTLAGV